MKISGFAFSWLNRIGVFGLAFWFSSCLFSVESGHRQPRTKFEFSQVELLKNPLSTWYDIPQNKCLVGLAFAFTSLAYQNQIDSNINHFSNEIGAKPYFAGTYFDLATKQENFKMALRTIHAHQVVPYITFDPKIWVDLQKQGSNGIGSQKNLLKQILAGNFDNKLKEIARVITDFDHPILLRFAHEMNGNWYPYSGKYIGGGLDVDRNGEADGPQTYQAAWRYVHDLFKAEGATKIVWVYCPNGESFPKAEWNRPFSYYPGSKYVDLIASDSYETPEKYNDDLEPIMVDIFNEMGLFWEAHMGDPEYEIRPFGLGEFGTSRKSIQDKFYWFDSALKYLKQDSRLMFQAIYQTHNPGMNFSIRGIGLRLRKEYKHPRFLFANSSAEL